MEKAQILKSIYRTPLALLTDLYEITMAYGYWKNGLAQRKAVFQLFFRKKPFGGSYAVCAGVEFALDYIRNFQFCQEDLDYLAGLKSPADTPLFERAFLDYLRDFKITLDVDAMQEGSLVFPYEPIIRVQGPIIEAQIMESALLNIINFQTLIATKASRISYACRGDQLIEFGLRRAQGIDGAISASRASFIGGCDASSNVIAGKLFDIPVMGTHAHSWVMTFNDESDSFRTFAHTLPHNCIFLIDTYDTISGVKNAIKVAKELKKEKIQVIGVRLDSGDLNKLSQKVRILLDEAGFEEVKIMATNELNEQIIWDLKNQGAKIDIWASGTHLVTAKDQPALDGVYKLSAIDDGKGNWSYRLKISDQMIKTTNPGISQVRRYFNDAGYVADMLYDVHLGLPKSPSIIEHVDSNHELFVDEKWDYEDLLKPMLRSGKNVYTHPSLNKMRNRTVSSLQKLDSSHRRFLNPQPFFAGIEKRLYEKKLNMIEEIRQK